jgi:predicted nucleic-acid-binding protein
MRDDENSEQNKHYKPYNEQYVVLSIVHVCKNVYEIEHELIYEVYAIPNVICSVVPKCEGG